MNRYINFVLRHPIAVLFFLVLATVVLTPGMTRLEFDNSIECFMPLNDPDYIYYNSVKDQHGDNGRFVIMAVSNEDLWSPGTFQKIDALLVDLEEYEEFNGERETRRVERFEKILSRGDIQFGEMISIFNDDPGFTRFLRRKVGKLFGTIDYLNEGHLKRLKKEIVKARDFKKLELIDDIISPLTAKDISGENDTLETYDLIEKDNEGRRILPSSREEFNGFRQKLERNPAFEEGIYARDGESGKITDFAIVIKFVNMLDQDPIVREVKEIISSHDGLDITITGVPVVNISMHTYMQSDMFILTPIVLLVVIFVFYFNFRSVRGVILPFFTLGMAELWLFGLMGYLGYKITPLGISLPPLMIAVGSSYSIHILNQYYADFDMISKEGKMKGLLHSMSHISLTVLLAGFTTFIAFITLTTSRIAAVREWGFLSAVGVVFAVVISSSLIPSCLKLMPHKIPSLLRGKDKVLKKTIVDRIVLLFTKGAIIHHRKVVAVVILLLGISLVGISKLEVETTFLSYFKDNDPVRKDGSFIGEKFGGGVGFNILIDSGEVDGVKSPQFLAMIEDLREWLVSDENDDLNIGRTDSFTDLIKTMHMAMNNDDSAMYKIPEAKGDIADYLEIYSGDDEDSDGRFDEFEPFVDFDFKTLNLLTRMHGKRDLLLGTAVTKHTVKSISDYMDNHLPDSYSYRMTGFPTMEIKLVNYVITGQLQSLLYSLIVVGIIVALLFNHLKVGPLALIPMSVAVIINFGIMGWFGVKLDMATSIIAAVTIGIGVDDTIHFLNTFRYNRARGCSVDETIARTSAVSGKAIVFTSLALILGHLVLVVSNFIPIILFGVLMAGTMIATTIGALLVLPSVIKFTAIDLDIYEPKTAVGKYLNMGKIFGLEQEEQ
jgi:predicted RND superfamily exporter protein